MHGDGTSLWTLTHHRDFARAFVGLLGHPAAIGDSFHITSDEWLTWNQIFTLVAAAAGVEPRLVHVPSDAIAAADPEWGAGPARRQGPLDDLRQHQGAPAGPRLRRRHPVPHRAPGRSSTGTTQIPGGGKSTPRWTPPWIDWSPRTGPARTRRRPNQRADMQLMRIGAGAGDLAFRCSEFGDLIALVTRRRQVENARWRRSAALV